MREFAGIQGIPGMTSYAASKFAVRGLCRVAARELGPLGIRVNCLLPGGTDTAMLPEPQRSPDAFATQPIARVSEPIEQARVVLFLISDESSYCTGTDFICDGGYVA